MIPFSNSNICSLYKNWLHRALFSFIFWFWLAFSCAVLYWTRLCWHFMVILVFSKFVMMNVHQYCVCKCSQMMSVLTDSNILLIDVGWFIYALVNHAIVGSDYNCSASKHYLKQWYILNLTLENIFRWHLNLNTVLFRHEPETENVAFNKLTIFFLGPSMC